MCVPTSTAFMMLASSSRISVATLSLKKRIMTKVNEILIVLAAGAIGALLSVSDAWVTPDPLPFTWLKFATLAAIPAAKGAAASGLAVYLLTSLDPSQFVRTCFFALACGYTFPGVLTNAADFSKKAISQVAVQTVADGKEKIAAATPAAAASAVSLPASSVAQIKDASISILQASSKVPESEVKTTEAAVQQGVSALGNSGNATRDAAPAAAIADIGVQAAVQNNRAGVEAAVQQLNMIQSTVGVSPAARAAAELGVQRIDRAPK